MALDTPLATTTTTKDILHQLKRVFLEHQFERLRNVKTYKLGVLPPQPVFPAINIMPEAENYDYSLSGGKYGVQRDFLVEVFSRHRTPAEAMDETRDIVGILKQIVKENIFVNRQSIDVEIWPRIFEETLNFQGQYMQIGTLPLRTHSYEFMPENRLEAYELVPTTSSELIDDIYSALDYHRRQPPPFTLRNVAQLEKSRIPPIANFPAITVIEPQIDQNREYAGLDAGERLFEISIWHRLLDKDPMLMESLEIMEVVKDVIQIHHMFGGKSMLSRVINIQFARETLEVGRVYRTTVRVLTISEEVNPSQF